MGDRTKADEYQAGQPQMHVPKDAVNCVQVVIFDDNSIHVAAPPIGGLDETPMIQALVDGLDAMGYAAELTPHDSGPGHVELTGIHTPGTAVPGEA